ncbi:aldehyde dehydrogenase family protein [Maridesulfovibrio salexigens]|uniref:Acetaldehyde dehydrogenase-like protein n=1 Tax=Maridesulfovibrio salexigens (strain ATCC 14822 / DSM 2638 / NCIMB 8403 / VKM B-1763) TaxID=526222 RepID=C6BX54_MARSD|nr:aldehyde dehydrogenase family protein [Maridesulfovibrio salexigens]ACS78534.1 acetaldehyde dehydrogenase-like protein [Maridesulfovibrio salexigens DSM 2638]
MIVDNDLLSIQQARILAENAHEAQKELATFPQEKLDEIVEHIADAVEEHAEELAIMSHEETDGGKWQDKLVKNRFVCNQVRKELRGMRCVGVIKEDSQKKITDIGVPVGVIAALCPVTGPVSTTVYNTLIAIKSGNGVIFSPHPGAVKSIGRVLDIMIKAGESCGLPEGCLSYLETVTKSGTCELMNHRNVSLVMVTGVPGMIQYAQKTGKPVIYGGTGNGPAFIERTADIGQAVKDIIASKTFDNGIAPSAEQSIVVDSCVAENVRQSLNSCGAYFMSESEAEALAELFIAPDGQRRKGMAGQSAQVLARRAGFTIPENTTVLVAERKYVSDTDPYYREFLSPVLALYVEDDWMHACEKCIELLLHERNAHTLVIHSADEDVILQFALKKPVGRLLVNTPAAFGGMGATTNLFPSMTLGSSSAGFGITSDNVSPMNLIYIRKVGCGVRRAEEVLGQSGQAGGQYKVKDNDSNMVQVIQQILQKAIEAIDDPADR